MAGEIQVQYTTSGLTLYALVRNATGSVWQTTTSTFVTYVTANLANYTIALAEQGTASRFYAGTFPAAAAGSYSVTSFVRAGGSAAETDTVAATGNIEWSGTAVNSLAGIPTQVWQDTTAGDFTVASSIGKSLFTSGAVPGAAGGLLIAGSNAATTFAGLTTGALSCTTITASGAVAFQSTFAVTTSTSFAALSCTTLTASGAVAFQSTFAVTTSTALGALSCSTFAASGTVTFNAFTVTNATTLSGAVSLGSTLTVTGTTTLAVLTQVGNMTWGNTTWGASTDFTSTQKTSIGTAVAASAVASVTGNVGGNVNGNVVGSVGSVTATVTVTGDFSATMKTSITTAATAATPTIAATQAFNNTGTWTGNVVGTVSTVTNLTNAPTNGDFTAAMKTSLNAATPASIQNVDNVWTVTTRQLTGTQAFNLTGNITGNLSGSVGSVTTVTNIVSGVSAQITTDHGSGSYQTATGFSTLTQAQITGGLYAMNDAAFAFNAGLDFTTTQKTSLNAANPVLDWSKVTNQGSMVVLSDTYISGLSGGIANFDDFDAVLNSEHGSGSWATATGFSTPTNVTNAVTAIEAYGDLHWTTATGFAVPGDAMTIAADGLAAASIASGALTVAVWDEAIAGHTTSGTFGGALNSASSAGDPWNTMLPGAYASGTAGYILGNGVQLAADGMDNVVVEVGLNARQALSIIGSANGGVLSGAGTTNIIIHGGGVSDTRINATVDGFGNRTAVTLTPPA